MDSESETTVEITKNQNVYFLHKKISNHFSNTGGVRLRLYHHIWKADLCGEEVKETRHLLYLKKNIVYTI